MNRCQKWKPRALQKEDPCGSHIFHFWARVMSDTPMFIKCVHELVGSDVDTTGIQAQPAEGKDGKGIHMPMPADRNQLPEKPSIKRLQTLSRFPRGEAVEQCQCPLGLGRVTTAFTHTFHSWLHQRKWGENDSISSVHTPSMTHMASQPRQLSTR